MNIATLSLVKWKRTSKTLKIAVQKKNLSVHFQRLPEGAVVLTLVFKQTSSVASAASVSECLTLLLALDPGHLTLSLDE